MADKVYQGDVGTIIRIDCNDTISTATDTFIMFKKPDGTLKTWAATIYGTEYLTYTLTAQDTDIIGIGYVQPKLTLSGWTGRGKTCALPIHAHFD
jgi:hypothetical protein